ncbi:MAG: haloacid dehalogenase type II, partial [Proteobacteria bacterium]|nr:haloacid dehalogenase type II [Pseudomonadota bacterium]
RALYQPAMERVRSGCIEFVPLDQLHRENLDQTLIEFSLTNVSEAEIANLNLAWHRLDPWPDVVPGLQKLKSGYQIGTLSNGNIDLIKNMARHAGLPWDAILGAEVARAYKPQPQAYLGSAAAIGFEPSQCMLVAAHNNDLKAALEVGFKTAFVARPFEHGSDQETDLFAEEEYDIVAQDFMDLAEQLGC